jgi:hypothetical protein
MPLPTAAVFLDHGFNGFRHSAGIVRVATTVDIILPG